MMVNDIVVGKLLFLEYLNFQVRLSILFLLSFERRSAKRINMAVKALVRTRRFIIVLADRRKVTDAIVYHWCMLLCFV